MKSYLWCFVFFVYGVVMATRCVMIGDAGGAVLHTSIAWFQASHALLIWMFRNTRPL